MTVKSTLKTTDNLPSVNISTRQSNALFIRLTDGRIILGYWDGERWRPQGSTFNQIPIKEIVWWEDAETIAYRLEHQALVDGNNNPTR